MKMFNSQRRMASDILKAGLSRIKFNKERLDSLKEAITREDIRKLIREGTIYKIQKQGITKYRARKIKVQKSKGRRKGKGSRKGSRNSRFGRKRAWVLMVRVQRRFLNELKAKNLISKKTATDIYSKIKGGYFRSRRHIKIYLKEGGLFNKK